MREIDFNDNDLNWDKTNGLIPAIIQDAKVGTVLMLGYMNKEALEITLKTGRVTFYSRSKQKIWVKGETSGNYLKLKTITLDCDSDTFLIMVSPEGPTCHKGDQSCFKSNNKLNDWNILQTLETLILSRVREGSPDSYTVSLLNSGINKVTQKVGEEAVETVIAGLMESDEQLCNEIADLFYHTLVLLNCRKLFLADVLTVLVTRLNAKFVRIDRISNKNRRIR